MIKMRIVLIGVRFWVKASDLIVNELLFIVRQLVISHVVIGIRRGRSLDKLTRFRVIRADAVAAPGK